MSAISPSDYLQYESAAEKQVGASTQSAMIDDTFSALAAANSPNTSTSASGLTDMSAMAPQVKTSSMLQSPMGMISSASTNVSGISK